MRAISFNAVAAAVSLTLGCESTRTVDLPLDVVRTRLPGPFLRASTQPAGESWLMARPASIEEQRFIASGLEWGKIISPHYYVYYAQYDKRDGAYRISAPLPPPGGSRVTSVVLCDAGHGRTEVKVKSTRHPHIFALRPDSRDRPYERLVLDHLEAAIASTELPSTDAAQGRDNQ